MKNSISFITPSSKNQYIISWVTDLHLDQALSADTEKFLNALKLLDTEALLIGGDTSHGKDFIQWFEKIGSFFKGPIYFVLGNHDYYDHSIHEIREFVKNWCKENPRFQYLTMQNVLSLSKSTALVGHDGWGDARFGNFLTSTVTLSDYSMIDELKNSQGKQLQSILMELGKKAADHIRKNLEKAVMDHEQVIILTHIPPFRECCVYDGKMCDENWGPHFICQALGDQIKSLANKHPNHKFLTLSGHSHSKADVLVLPNLRAVAGHADIGVPKLQPVITYC